MKSIKGFFLAQSWLLYLSVAILALFLIGAYIVYPKIWPGQVKGDTAVEVAFTVDAAQEGNTVYPTVYGGDEVLNNSDSLWALEEYTRGSNLSKMSLRVHTNDDGYGWKWDSNLLDIRTGKKTWCKNGLRGCAQVFPSEDQSYHHTMDVVDYDQGNKFVLDYWDGTDMTHSGKIIKTTEGRSAYMKVDVPAGNASGYMRFDLKIDSERTFSSPDSGWELFRAEEAYNKISVNVYLTDDRRLDVRCTDKAGAIHQLALSQPLVSDQYYSFETYYGGGECVYWVNQIEIGRTSLTTRLALNDLKLGAVTSTLASQGQIHLDAFRMDTTYVGGNVEMPWRHKYIYSITFDSNLRSIDDIAQVAERMGASIIWTIPVPNKNNSAYIENTDNNGWDWQTMQFYADMVEYLNGSADSNYEALAKNLDWTHKTPSDNWANLRAARGRVVSYNQIYFEIGNEPYYGGLWRDTVKGDDVAGYAQQVKAYGQAFKAIDSRVKIGFGSFLGDWYPTVLPIVHDVVDWVSLYHHYAYSKGHSALQWISIPQAYGNGWQYHNGNKTDWISRPYGSANPAGGDKFYYEPYMAKVRIKQYLSDRADVNDIFLATTEYGYFLTPGIGDENWWGTALNRASWLGTFIESGERFANVWTVFSDNYAMGLLSFQSYGVEVSPSFNVYKLFADHFGTKLVNSTFTQPQAPYAMGTPDTFGSSGWYYPYISTWSSLNDGKNKMYIMFINRNSTTPVTATINLQNFVPNDTAAVYTISSPNLCDDNEPISHGSMNWWCPDDGNSDPNHITAIQTTKSGVANSFTYTYEPYSVTAIEISGRIGTACIASCSCGAATCSGKTCSDGCGGTCAGEATENWSCGSWSSCASNSKQTRTCIDLNGCSINKTETQSCTYIPVVTKCTPRWTCGSFGSCSISGRQIRQCWDENSCGVDTNKPAELQTCTYTSTSGSGSTTVVNSTSSVTTVVANASDSEIRKTFFKGRLVKTKDSSAVYHVGADGKRRLFVNEVTFWSWRTGPWSNQTVDIISQAEFDALPVGKNITARPGAKLIKFDNSNKVYAVTSDDKLCYVSAGYGEDWRNKIITIQSSFENDYVRSSACDVISSNSKYPDGTLIQYKNSTVIYYIENGKKRSVSSTVFAANAFKKADVITDVSTSIYYSTGNALTAW